MIELVFQTPLQDTDWISDCLMSAGALAVTVEDAQADEEDERPIFAEPGMPTEMLAWSYSTVITLLPQGISPKDFWQKAAEIEPRLAEIAFDVRSVGEADWVHETQKHFTPFEIKDALWIGPTWEEPPGNLRAQKRVIFLDPGMAFGTGSHATTQLCLEQIVLWGRRQNKTGGLGSVLDMGCGSGILALAASMLGAQPVIGVDIDPLAIDASLRNSAANQLAAQFVGADALPEGSFDLVVANILCQPLKVLAPSIVGRIKPGGSLFISGILARQADEIIGVYKPLCEGLAEPAVLGARDGWVCIGFLQT